MNKQDDFSLNIAWGCRDAGKYAFAGMALLVFLLLIYSNSFHCSWHFDDYVNIVNNTVIQAEQPTWPEIQKSLFGIARNQHWNRPVSYLSFALNYHWGGLHVFGYHVVNFMIHYLAAFFLFLFIYHTMKLPLLEPRYGRYAYAVALLSVFFWAGHPIHVASVTYIVQRMAGMAGLFYIMSMFFYLRGRTSEVLWRKRLWYGFFIISGILALGTKENAAMLPVSVFLYDLLLIQGVTGRNIRKNFKYALLAFAVVLAIGWMYIDNYPGAPLGHGPHFSLVERILTFPRVMLFYVSLLLYPLNSRMMMIHDMDVSTSLLHPLTTLPAMLGMIIIIAGAFFMLRKRPLIAYCIFFFFLNHLIEGSFISLELVYEHRNYLPSMLFFVPLSVLAIRGMAYFSFRKAIYYVLVTTVTVILVIQGIAVYIQNGAYRDEITLWMDNVEKAPRLHRTHHNLGTAYFMAGRLPEALGELNLALNSHDAANAWDIRKTYGLLGEYYLIKGDDDRAMLYYQESVRRDPSFCVGYARLAEIMIRKDRLPEADAWIGMAMVGQPGASLLHVIKAQIFLRKGDPDAAIGEAQMALRLQGHRSDPYVILSEAFRMKKDFITAAHFRKVAENIQSRGEGQPYGSSRDQAALR